MAGPAGSGRGTPDKDEPVLITDAAAGASRELRGREVRYAITMAFRTACFISMIFVPGPFRWVLFGAAVFLPYVAVLLANQRHERGAYSVITPGTPLDAPQLTTGLGPEVISGAVVDEDVAREDRVA
ncbi:MAG: DUF3099 domain-containing protein [Actinomycetes bacterium]